jgi:hypothetical protein
MIYRTRTNYTAQQKSEMWDSWQRGESLKTIGRAFDQPSSSIFGQFSPTDGIPASSPTKIFKFSIESFRP